MYNCYRSLEESITTFLHSAAYFMMLLLLPDHLEAERLLERSHCEPL